MENTLKYDFQFVVHDDCNVCWLKNKTYHREDGPAIERPDGSEEWYKNNELHRKNGPAVIHPDGTKEWWVNGKNVDK